MVSEAPWGPRLILATTSKLPSEKTEKCNTGSYWWSSSDKNGTEECFRYLLSLGRPPLFDTLTTIPMSEAFFITPDLALYQ